MALPRSLDALRARMRGIAALLKRRPDLRTAVLLADLPDGLSVELYHALGDERAAADGEARRAAESRAERSQRVRAAIRAAVGARPPGERGLAPWVQRYKFALKGFPVPHLSTIRAVLAEMAAEKKTCGFDMKPSQAPEGVCDVEGLST